LRPLDPRRRALHKKHACQIEECANRYMPNVLFNEIATPDPLLGKYGGVVIAHAARRNRMVVRYTLPNGVKVHGPPYTKAETRDMFWRMRNGPRMMTSVVRGPSAHSTNSDKPETSRSAAHGANQSSPPSPQKE
jgi:hypothetical protein